MPERIYIYNENCAMAGKQVPQRELERYDNPEDGCDWSGYEASEEMAALLEQHQGLYGIKCARTIREYLR